MEHTRWIVVGTDFSDDARSALERALRLAEDSGARVALVHAYEEAPGGEMVEDPTPKLTETLAQVIAASGAAKRGIHVESCIRRGAAWEKLLNVATDVWRRAHRARQERSTRLLHSAASRCVCSRSRSAASWWLHLEHGGARA